MSYGNIFQYGILMGTCRAVAFLTFLGHFVHDCLLHPDFTFGKMRISLAVFLLNKAMDSRALVRWIAMMPHLSSPQRASIEASGSEDSHSTFSKTYSKVTNRSGEICSRIFAILSINSSRSKWFAPMIFSRWSAITLIIHPGRVYCRFPKSATLPDIEFHGIFYCR